MNKKILILTILFSFSAYADIPENHCAKDLLSQFSKFGKKRRHQNRKVYRIKKRRKLHTPWNLFRDHIQGVGAIQSQDGLKLIQTRSSRYMDQGGFFSANFSSSKKTKKVNFTAVTGTSHPGGLQVIGDHFLIANECGSGRCDAFISFYDSKNEELPYKTLTLDGSQGELFDEEGNSIDTRAAAVAITKQDSGKYLLFIGGRHSSKSGWFFETEQPALNKNTSFKYLDYWHSKELEGGQWHGSENLNFIKDCKSKKTYLIAMGTMSNKMSLYDFSHDENKNFSIRHIKTVKVRRRFGINLRNGGGVYVSPEGEMTLYMAGRFGNRVLEVR